MKEWKTIFGKKTCRKVAVDEPPNSRLKQQLIFDFFLDVFSQQMMTSIIKRIQVNKNQRETFFKQYWLSITEFEHFPQTKAKKLCDKIDLLFKDRIEKWKLVVWAPKLRSFIYSYFSNL